jgi:uncharacterized BrkB/YihY/UPF0761 family membrane protein
MKLLRAGALVGGIGAAISTPLLFALAAGTSGLWRNELFFWLSPLGIFACAALVFACVFVVLPKSPRRARYAGAIAGVLTFFAYEILYSRVFNFDTGFRGYPFALFPYLASFIVMGWVPILGGLFAGAKAERYLDESSR